MFLYKCTKELPHLSMTSVVILLYSITSSDIIIIYSKRREIGKYEEIKESNSKHCYGTPVGSNCNSFNKH